MIPRGGGGQGRIQDSVLIEAIASVSAATMTVVVVSLEKPLAALALAVELEERVLVKAPESDDAAALQGGGEGFAAYAD